MRFQFSITRYHLKETYFISTITGKQNDPTLKVLDIEKGTKT